METSPLICSEKEWTSFYMIGNSVMNELKNELELVIKVFVAADKLNTFRFFEWKHNNLKANNGLTLCCKLWTILAQWYMALIEYSVLHIIFLTFSYSDIKKGKCNNGNKTCSITLFCCHCWWQRFFLLIYSQSVLL